MATFSLTIGGVEKKHLITTKSVNITTSVGGRPCEMRFSMPNTTAPTMDEEIIFTVDSVKKFAGRVVRISKDQSSLTQECQVYCQDYSRDANKGELIAEIYENWTGEDIIDDICTRYSQLSGFTQNNVSCPIVIPYLYLDHKTFYEVLKAIAQQTAYEFYIDFDKDIHFYKIGAESATFGINDTNGNALQDSISIDEAGDEIVNYIVVEGGEYDASEISTENWTATGGETELSVSGRYSGVTVTVNTVAKTVGVSGIHDDAFGTTYQVLYDFSGRRLRFYTALTAGQAVVLTGYQKLPVLVQVDDSASISIHGILPKKVKNNDLKTIDAAKAYGLAELEKYAQDQITGAFSTYGSVRAGQRIQIINTVLGVSGFYDIQRTSSRFHDSEGFITQCSVSSSEITDAVSLLMELLRAKNTSTSASEVLRLYKTVQEQVGIGDSLAVDANKEEFSEETGVADTLDNATNKTIQWVLGDYVPTSFSDNKRVPLLDWSPATLL